MLDFTTPSTLRALARIRYGFLCLLLIASSSVVWGQTAYYVSSTGNDSNNGSANAPFLTLTKVSSLTLKPGDQILFRRGDTFRGTLYIRQSGSAGNPIIIDAYGSGNKPILAGSVPVSGWTNTGNNIWQASCSSCGSRVTGLYRNSAALPLGRYPNLSADNKGYLTIQSHAGKTQLTSQQALGTNWTGGEAVVRPLQWILDRATITQQNGNTLTLNNPNSRDLADGWGYFIQNHPATLDQTDEWYYNPSNKTIQLFNQGDPNSQPITATVASEGVNLTNASYITIRNLKITETLGTGLLVNSGSNLVFSGNDITDSGEDGVVITGSGNNVLAENNLIEDANNNGLAILPYQNFTFRGNTIRRVGLLPGRGKSGDGSYIGFQSLCTLNTLIENNVVDNIGYNGIAYSTSTTIRRNQISNFCQVKSDGGGLYIWNGNQQGMNDIHLISNVVYNGIGAPEGTPGGAYSGANGIFFDDCAKNVEVTGNSVFNCRGLGIFMHASSNITLTANTVYNNGGGQLAITDDQGVCPVRNNSVQNNLFVSRLPDQFNVKYESNANDLSSYGQFDYNVYARPFEDVFKIRAVYNPGSGITGADLALAEWQSRFGKDLHSTNSPLTYKTYTLTANGAVKLNNTFSANTEGWSTWSPYGNGQAIWDNTNRLDAGSLRVAFGSASNKSDSYVIATNPIGSVSKGKTYQLLFDAVASSASKRVEVFIRQRDGSYSDLAPRSINLVGTTRQTYEAAFTATADEANAIVVLQVTEDGQTVWFDNIHLQEATKTTVNPDDYIKLLYNQTASDLTVSLDNRYRDAKNAAYSGQVTLPAYSSLVLFKDTSPTVTPVTLRDPENPANAVNGLDYSYYEGSWSAIPDYSTVTAAKQGSVSSVDLTVRNRSEQFVIRYQGYVNVPTDGTYTFYTSSDDGSKLSIGTTEVVNNDGLHSSAEKSGTIGLKAGKHALTISYLQGAGGQELTVSYSGPNLAKQAIPATAYFRVPVATSGGTGAGLLAEYFNNTTLSAPTVLTRTDATVNFDWSNSSPANGTVNADNFSARWTGQVEAPVSGNYTFSTISDDAVRLWINGTQVINNWVGHGPTTDNSAAIALTAGQKYDIRMEYYEGPGGAVAKLLWAYPGQAQQPIPQTRLYPATAASTTPTGNGTVTYLSDLTWSTMTNGYGSAEKDRSNGEAGSSDGHTLTLNGVTYAKGIGTHAPSEITYNLGGKYTTFSTDMGIDDEIGSGSCGTVVFEVYADNVLIYSSGAMTPTTATKSISLDVTGKQTLKLVANATADGNCGDHADWAGAKLTGSSGGRLAAAGAEAVESVVRVYPIPARDEIRVRYHADAAGEVTVQLVNITAQSVLDQLHQATPGENVFIVPVGHLNRGFYILNLNQNGQRITRKVLLSE